MKRMQWNIEKILMITIKTLQIIQMLALDNPLGVDILLNKSN